MRLEAACCEQAVVALACMAELLPRITGPGASDAHEPHSLGHKIDSASDVRYQYCCMNVTKSRNDMYENEKFIIYLQKLMS
jgi:hypothetical protein